MAMDNFLEEVATKRNRGMETAMYVLARYWISKRPTSAARYGKTG